MDKATFETTIESESEILQLEEYIASLENNIKKALQYQHEEVKLHKYLDKLKYLTERY